MLHRITIKTPCERQTFAWVNGALVPVEDAREAVATEMNIDRIIERLEREVEAARSR